jgi:transcriptional regulator with XRE-family HTH domain
MTTLHTLGQRLAQARRELAVRERRDVSQADVADAVGYSRTAVSEWEAGTKIPREEALAKLATFLGVTPAFLRYGIVTPLVQLTDAQVEDSLARGAEARADRGLPPIGPDDVHPDTIHYDPPAAKKAAGGRRSTRRPKGGK